MNNKYELVHDDTVVTNCGTVLYRIRALTTINNTVSIGDLGGYIEADKNLSPSGKCWVYDNARVYGDARVYENAQVYGDARVYGNAQVYGDAAVFEYACVDENACVHGNAHVFGHCRVYGDAQIDSAAGVNGTVHISGSVIVTENATVTANALVSEKAIVRGDSVVSGSAQLYDSVVVSGNAFVRGRASVRGNAVVSGSAQLYDSVVVQGSSKVGDNDHLRYGIVDTDGELSIIDQLKHSMGVAPINGKVILYKRVRADYSSEYDKEFIYPRSGEVSILNADTSNTSCASGLHFSHMYYGMWVNLSDSHIFIAAEIDVADIICVQSGKVRCRKATILGEV